MKKPFSDKDKNEINESAANGSVKENEETVGGPGAENEEPGKTKESKKPSIKRLFSTRGFKYGAASSTYALMFIAAVIVLNIIFSVLAQRLPLKIDLTPEKLYDITESRDYVKSVKDKINITILSNEATFEDNFGNEGSATVELIKKYTVLNPNITLSFKDIYVNPQLKDQYKNVELTESSIVVESAKRYKVLDNNDLYVITTDNDGVESVQAFKGEQKITSAISYVTSDTVQGMLFTNNHEESGMTALEELAQDNSFDVAETDLQVSTIPDNTRVIAIYNPVRDFTPAEINILDSFADKGDVGFMVFLSAGSTRAQLPNLTEFLEEWNISPKDDLISDDTYYFGNSIYYLIPERGENAITSGIDADVKLIMPFAKSFDITSKSGSQFDTFSIIRSADSSTSSSIFGTGSTKGNFDIAAASSKGIIGTSLTSKMVVFGSFDIANSSLLSSNSFANSQVLINTFNFIRGDQDIVSILPKYYQDYTMTITSVESLFFGFIFVLLFPVALLITGLVVFLRRRHL